MTLRGNVYKRIQANRQRAAMVANESSLIRPTTIADPDAMQAEDGRNVSLFATIAEKFGQSIADEAIQITQRKAKRMRKAGTPLGGHGFCAYLNAVARNLAAEHSKTV
jgi:hypothetical protein